MSSAPHFQWIPGRLLCLPRRWDGRYVRRTISTSVQRLSIRCQNVCCLSRNPQTIRYGILGRIRSQRAIGRCITPHREHPELGEGGHAQQLPTSSQRQTTTSPTCQKQKHPQNTIFVDSPRLPSIRASLREQGKGPDGAALAAAVPSRSRVRVSRPVDSFLNEGSFVFNPLNRRVHSPHRVRQRREPFPRPTTPPFSCCFGSFHSFRCMTLLQPSRDCPHKGISLSWISLDLPVSLCPRQRANLRSIRPKHLQQTMTTQLSFH